MPARQPKRYTFDQFLAVRRYGLGLAFSPDGEDIAYITNTSGQFNVWRQPSAGGYPLQLTLLLDDVARDLAWSPDGKTIAFNADLEGNEMHQLFVIPAGGGAPEQLTHAGEVQHFLNAHSWSPSGRYLAYNANDRDPRDQDILVRDMRTGETTRVLAEGAYFSFANWAPNGRHLLAVNELSNTNTDIYLVDTRKPSHDNLTLHEGEVVHVPAGWAADGSGFYLLTNAGRETIGLAYYDLSSRERRWIATPRWDVELAQVSPDGRWLAWCVNVDGYSRLTVQNLKTGERRKLPALPRGVVAILRFAPDGSRLAVLLTTPTHSAELYVLDLRPRRAVLARITQSMLGGINERDLVTPQIVRFTSFDGRKIPAYLYRPKGVEGRVPAVLSIHGGPEAQERPGYNYGGLYQYWLNRGIAVLAPNIRGSTGYGLSYQCLIHHDWGGAELRDIEAAAQYLQSLEWVDPSRLAVFGGSFGGFATLSAVARLPDYWAAAVDLVGPSNLLTFVKSVPPSWRRFMDKWVGNPETDYDFLVERSPITYVDQIRAPLFIIQGAHDPRVVQAESDQIVERLRARGVPVRYDVYPDEGHGFTKRANELKGLRDSAQFIEEHLTDEHVNNEHVST